jgi:hypothetical protein
VRLTLRTLLAYLDDTLEPAEIKQIGQKVAESDAAQELVARIKQVTRRRRLTTPPATGPGARFDPNTVAEYLDNELPSDQVSELEKQCLDSDVHLAEIAACHQILTLVLGEPALVPPTAKERMYGLVQGREAIPFRKAGTPQTATTAAAPTRADADADEMLLLGLPFYRRGTWLRWALPLAAVLLVSVLGVALWQAIASTNPHDPGRQVANNAGDNRKDGTEKGPDGDGKKEPTPPVEPPKDTLVKPPPEPPKDPVVKPEEPPKDTSLKTSPNSKILPASKERVEAGSYQSDPKDPPSILVQREAEGNEGWRRLKPGSHVWTSDRLVSLPGYASDVRLDNGVRLTLRGHLREFSDPREPAMDYLLESAVVLHKPAKDFDADLTLDRGRLFVSSHKETSPATVRLRFGRDDSEVWDLNLQEPGTEIVVDLLKHYTRDVNYRDGEDPRTELVLVVLRGTASVRIDFYHHSNLKAPQGGGAMFLWNNKGAGAQGPIPIDKLPPFVFSKAPPTTKEAQVMVVALKELSAKMVDKKPPSVALGEFQESDRLPHRVLAIYSYCGLDEVRKLIDTLGDEDPEHRIERDTAIFTLRRWISRDAGQSNLLYDKKNKTGLLLAGQKYRPSEAETLALLLHDFNDEARKTVETFQTLADWMAHEKVAIAELAYWQLRHLALGAVKLPPFNAALPREQREKAADEVRKLIDAGKLPPAPPSPGGARGG